MREIYFTRELIEQQALDLYQQVPGIDHKKGLIFLPRQSALLVLDMQEYFLSKASHAYIPSACAIVDGIIRLVRAYSAIGRPVVFTQHINSARDAGMMANWWSDLIMADNPMQGIIPEIDTSLGTLLQKSQYDAFYQTSLDDVLRAHDVLQVVICGVMTHLCCETTARSAFMRGYQVFFPVDGTATYRLDFHKASLLNLSHGFASVVLMSEILKAVQEDHEG